MMTNWEERRADTRVSYLCEVECPDFGPARLRISDLSRTGAFIETLNAVRRGSILQLKFKLKETEMAVAAEVRHSVINIGIGVRFLDLTPDEETFLSLVVAEQSPGQRAA